MCERERVCDFVCECVCHSEKKVPDEWQAQAILLVASTAQTKIQQEQVARFISRSLQFSQKKKEKQFTEPTHVAAFLFLCACMCVRV